MIEPARPWRIRLTGEARRSINALPDKVRLAGLELLAGRLSDNPHRVGHELTGGLRGLRSARRGEYRVIYRIDETPREVVVLRAQHRRTVYR